MFKGYKKMISPYKERTRNSCYLCNGNGLRVEIDISYGDKDEKYSIQLCPSLLSSLITILTITYIVIFVNYLET